MAETYGVMPKRAYGRDGVAISVVGFGGIVVKGASAADAAAWVEEAVARGVNYFDVAPSYGDAECVLGPALAPFRDGAFLACKTGRRDAAGAEEELARSLERLKTDHVDLYQLHGLTGIEKDVDPAFASGGAMETVIAAKKSGRVRHVGFSAHTEEAALAALERYAFDSVLFPLNFACWMRGGFGRRVVEAARGVGVTVLALKTLAREKWSDGDPLRARFPNCWYRPITDEAEAGAAARFTLGLPVAAAVSPGDMDLFRTMADAAAGGGADAGLSEEDRALLEAVAAGVQPIFG